MADSFPPFPPFRPRPPWWGPDLQTLRNVLVPPRPGLAGFASQRLALAMADGSGDSLLGLLQRPDPPGPLADGAERALVVLIHGLAGSEDSAYVQASAGFWLRRGHPVLRLNLRGAGPSRTLCRQQYHAGRSGDLRDALYALDPALRAAGLVLVGYSLGGNMLLKFLAESGAGFPVRAAASVSAPIDLAAAARRILAPRNALYHWSLLRGLKSESLGDGAEISEGERQRVRAARNIVEFDDSFVAPRNGFADAADYYARCAARGFLRKIEVPTLLIHALDDPWIPAEAYTGFPWRENPKLQPLLVRGGGHVGFHARGDRSAWHDRAIAHFVERAG